MKATIEGFGEMAVLRCEIRPQYRHYPPGPYMMPDGSILHLQSGVAEKIGRDVVILTGEWHGPDLPIGEPLSITFIGEALRCVVTDQDGTWLRLRGERTA